MRVSAICALSLLFSSATPGESQVQLKDHVGREFYVVFGPNTGGESGIETQNSISLNIVARSTAQVRVRVTSLRLDTTFIADAGQSRQFDLPNGNHGSRTAAIASQDTVSPGGAVWITSDNDISVYGLNAKRFSQDAFLALPVDALGVEYRIVSYQGSLPGQGSGMPGQFMVGATEDNTSVTITPRCRTLSRIDSGQSTTFEMNRGDALLVQSEHRSTADLTGSHVRSNKPVAVFAGHERTAIPHNATLYDGQPPSRDHLCEQLPPVTAFGDTFYVVPYSTTQAPDIVRIVSPQDQNEISINGFGVATLAAGEFFEIKELTAPSMIVSSKPSIVAQYMHTSMGVRNDPEFPSYGDPSLTVVPPVEQYLTQYDFHAYQADKTLVTIIFPATAYSSTYIDDVSLDHVTVIPGSDYVYATRQISSGAHTVRSSMPVSVSVYGFSDVASFAMPAGMGVEPGGMTRSSVAQADSVMDHSASLVVTDGDFRLSMVYPGGRVEIFDRSARRLESSKAAADGRVSIDVSSYASGLYYFSFDAEGGRRWGRMFIR